jgi:Protein of unknown function (DUF4446)
VAGAVLSGSTGGWIAIGAIVVAGCALVVAVLAFRQLGRIRAAQEVLLGGQKSDLVDFAVSLQGRVEDVHSAVDEIAAAVARVDRRVDSSLSRTSIVRYDALEGTGGQQSATIALLDSSRSGVVLSAIQGRDYARVYVKELERGRASVALSPEEQQAVERAMALGPE